MLQNTLNFLNDPGPLEAGGDDQGIGHTQSFGIVADHGVRAPADVHGRIGVLHLDRVLFSFFAQGTFDVAKMWHVCVLLLGLNYQGFETDENRSSKPILGT